MYGCRYKFLYCSPVTRFWQYRTFAGHTDHGVRSRSRPRLLAGLNMADFQLEATCRARGVSACMVWNRKRHRAKVGPKRLVM